MGTHSDNRYSTTDTPLAAWLYSQGFQLIEVNTDSFPSIFIFENHHNMTDSVHIYQLGKAVGNISLFYNAYRMLLRRVHPKYLFETKKT